MASAVPQCLDANLPYAHVGEMEAEVPQSHHANLPHDDDGEDGAECPSSPTPTSPSLDEGALAQQGFTPTMSSPDRSAVYWRASPPNPRLACGSSTATEARCRWPTPAIYQSGTCPRR